MTVSTTYDQIVDRCLQLVHNDAERERVAFEAKQRFQAMPMTAILGGQSLPVRNTPTKDQKRL